MFLTEHGLCSLTLLGINVSFLSSPWPFFFLIFIWSLTVLVGESILNISTDATHVLVGLNKYCKDLKEILGYLVQFMS